MVPHNFVVYLKNNSGIFKIPSYNYKNRSLYKDGRAAGIRQDPVMIGDPGLTPKVPNLLVDTGI